MSRSIPGALLAFVVLISFSSALSAAERLGQIETTWTFMFYMAADSKPELPWEDDLNEMEEAIQPPGTNIVALVDPLGTGNSMLLRVVHDPNESDEIISQPLEDGGAVIAGTEVMMADPGQLFAFVDFAAEEFPADRYVLVLWGHGAGWRGLCPDGNYIMSLSELGDALEAVRQSVGRPLDMVVVDACAEATLEVLYEIREGAHYLVASELLMPYEGLPWNTILTEHARDTERPVADLGKVIVADYIDWSRFVSPYSATMGVFDLQAADDLFSVFESISVLGTRYDSIFHEHLRIAFEAAEWYETDFCVDFQDLMRCVAEADLPLELRYLAHQASGACSEMTVLFESYVHPDPYDGIYARNASGITVYAPDSSYVDDAYLDLLVSGSAWDEFSRLVRRTSASNESAPGPSVSLSDSPYDDDSLDDSATVVWPNPYESLAVWIFGQVPGGLVLYGHVEAVGDSITLPSIPGDLVLSASAAIGGVAVTHDSLQATLHLHVDILVHVVENGPPSEHEFEAEIASANSTHVATRTDDIYATDVVVPDEILVGEIVRITVIDVQTGEVVGSRYAMLGWEGLNVTVSVNVVEREGEGVIGLLLMALLPGALVLLFDAMLYRENKKRAL